MSVNSKMTAIADAIRAKTGGTGLLTLDNMATEIENITIGININGVVQECPVKAGNTIAEGDFVQLIKTGWGASLPEFEITNLADRNYVQGFLLSPTRLLILYTLLTTAEYPNKTLYGLIYNYVNGEWIAGTAKVIRNATYGNLGLAFDSNLVLPFNENNFAILTLYDAHATETNYLRIVLNYASVADNVLTITSKNILTGLAYVANVASCKLNNDYAVLFANYSKADATTTFINSAWVLHRDPDTGTYTVGAEKTGLSNYTGLERIDDTHVLQYNRTTSATCAYRVLEISGSTISSVSTGSFTTAAYSAVKSLSDGYILVAGTTTLKLYKLEDTTLVDTGASATFTADSSYAQIIPLSSNQGILFKGNNWYEFFIDYNTPTITLNTPVTKEQVVSASLNGDFLCVTAGTEVRLYSSETLNTEAMSYVGIIDGVAKTGGGAGSNIEIYVPMEE